MGTSVVGIGSSTASDHDPSDRHQPDLPILAQILRSRDLVRKSIDVPNWSGEKGRRRGKLRVTCHLAIPAPWCRGTKSSFQWLPAFLKSCQHCSLFGKIGNAHALQLDRSRGLLWDKFYSVLHAGWSRLRREGLANEGFVAFASCTRQSAQ